MKRYLLFNFSPYSPSGGWNDFVASFDSREEAKAYIAADAEEKEHLEHGWQLVDAEVGAEVEIPADPVAWWDKE